MIVVKDYPRKESSISSTKDKKKEIVNIQYWGLVPLFDHRSVSGMGISLSMDRIEISLCYTINAIKIIKNRENVSCIDNFCET